MRYRGAMGDALVIAKAGGADLALLPALANRHGLISGATGTGKTVTLQTLAERFSAIGVPVFMADVKGDLSGIGAAGGGNAKVAERAQQLNIVLDARAAVRSCSGTCSASSGHPVRATISDMGPLLLARMLDLNDTQEGVLTLVFKVADDDGLAAARPEGPARDAAVRRRQRGRAHDRVRQRLGRIDRRDPARPARARSSRAAIGSSASRCSTSTT